MTTPVPIPLTCLTSLEPLAESELSRTTLRPRRLTTDRRQFSTALTSAVRRLDSSACSESTRIGLSTRIADREKQQQGGPESSWHLNTFVIGPITFPDATGFATERSSRRIGSLQTVQSDKPFLSR